MVGAAISDGWRHEFDRLITIVADLDASLGET